MTINANETEFAGFKVVDFDPEEGLSDLETTAPRIRVDYDSDPTFDERLDTLLGDERISELRCLVIGCWDAENDDITTAGLVKKLVAAKGKLGALRAIFVGDITYEEQEMSWIKQDDVGPLLDEFPELETFRVRGGDGLVIGTKKKHEKLRTLIVETGGMHHGIVESIVQGNFPALEHLELWIGTRNYGRTVTVDHLLPILSGKLFPRLRTLGLRNAENADEITAAVATAPILSRIERLDLSMGTVGDVGAEALLASPAVAKLKRLDLAHHYISDENQKRIHDLKIPVVDLNGRQANDDRYVQVGE